MSHKTVLMALSVLFMGLSGCGPSLVDAPPKFITDWPPARYMATPKRLPDVAAGEQLFESNAQCSAAYVEETGKLVALQRWITVLKR